MSTATETAIPACCAVCLIVPDDPGDLRNAGNPAPWSKYGNYWLCRDTGACTERAVAAQHAARGGQPPATGETSAPGTAPATSAPAHPRAGEGQPDAVPGAEDAAQAVQEAEPGDGGSDAA